MLKELSVTSGMALNDICVIISGMATSSVGMKELPYADVPFSLDGSSAYTEWIDAKGGIANPLFLISGVQQHDDVMRGEETQVVGVASLCDLPQQDLLYIWPGTHSKHVLVNNNNITSFKTFMTGEIFEMLRKHSILSHAVSMPASDNNISEEDKQSFQRGVSKSLNDELLNVLFSVRINQLKKYLSPELNYFYLSGLLIGSELKYIRKNLKQKLVLCSTGSLLQLYQMAIEFTGLSEHTIVVPAPILDNAAMAGQVKILNSTKSIRTHGK